MKKSTVCGVGLLLLAGCAGEPEMRVVAGQSATILNAYRASVRDFAAGQTALNNANERRLDQLRRQTADRRADIANRLDSWELSGDKEAIRRFSVISKVPAGEILAEMVPPPATVPPAALAFDAAAVDGLLKQLVELGKPVTTEQRLNGLVAFGTTLRERYRESLAEAAEFAAQATGEASEAAREVATQDDSSDGAAAEGEGSEP